MNIPAFTAEASLYKTSGRYRTGPQSPSGGRDGSVWSAAEVIVIDECNPGFIKIGEGSNAVCIPDPNYTGSDDQGDDPSQGDPTDRGGGRGRSNKPPPRGSHLCDLTNTSENPNPKGAQKCANKQGNEVWCSQDNKTQYCCSRNRDQFLNCSRIPNDPPTRIPLGGGGVPIGGGISF